MERLTHADLCIKTAQRFIKWVALYEYKSFASMKEEPDVLIFNEGNSILFEIKTSLADFLADRHKECRKKYRFPMWAEHIEWRMDISSDFRSKTATETEQKNPRKYHLRLKDGALEVELVEKEHLGNKRYFVCPWGVIPTEKLPEGWGLYYYKNGKFFLKKESGKFRSNLRLENALALHALRRYASGDPTGIMINMYQFDPGRRKRK